MKSLQKSIFSFTLLSFPLLAHAHGEEILVSIFAEGIAVITCLVCLQVVGLAKPHRLLGSIACILGVVVADFAVAEVPYNNNRVLVSFVVVIVPVLASIGAVLLGRLSVKKRNQT